MKPTQAAIVVLSKLLLSLIQLNTALQGLLSSWAAIPSIWLGTAGKEWRICQHTNCGMPRLCMTSAYKVSQTCKGAGRHHGVTASDQLLCLWGQRNCICAPLLWLQVLSQKLDLKSLPVSLDMLNMGLCGKNSCFVAVGAVLPGVFST